MPVNSKKIEKTLRSSQKDGSSTNIMLPPVFQSHGLNDTVLPLTLGEQLKAIIKPNCSQYRYEVFPGFHEVPDFILHRALEFLDEALAEKDNK
jgi:predicted esterase